ncbi:XdhC family protein [Anaeromyxobacter sp. Red801]|uniref:XdhC family protein n=1 Tax=Anaeromyxobacter sp. Red801 TaxID=3411632 RepID=UPI003BA225E2
MTDREILERAAGWSAAGRRVALATVVATWGSSPRPPGSQLAVSERGELAGSVSGGCVESAVAQEALEVLRAGAPRTLEYGVTAERAWEVGLPCGGRVRVFVEPARADALARDAGALRARERVERVLELGGGETFRLVLEAPVRLVIVGAVHLAQPLARMAEVAGYEVRLVDPRPVYATEARFPGVPVERAWPEEALARIGLDARTAVVTLSHDRKLDDPALAAALRSPAFYVGALGSRRTQAAIRSRLLEEGLGEAELARLHGPVGLDLGGEAPAELAVEILAQLVATLRRAPAPALAPGAAAGATDP